MRQTIPLRGRAPERERTPPLALWDEDTSCLRRLRDVGMSIGALDIWSSADLWPHFDIQHLRCTLLKEIFVGPARVTLACKRTYITLYASLRVTRDGYLLTRALGCLKTLPSRRTHPRLSKRSSWSVDAWRLLRAHLSTPCGMLVVLVVRLRPSSRRSNRRPPKVPHTPTQLEDRLPTIEKTTSRIAPYAEYGYCEGENRCV